MSTNFLWYAGSANNGLLSTALTVLSTETAFGTAMVTGNTALSSVINGNGIVTNANTNQAVFGDLFLTFGGTTSALSAGANLAGWFMTSLDGGTTFENYVANSALARPPDFIIPLPATAMAASQTYKAAGLVRLPALQFKVMVQNNTGQTFPASNTLKIAPVAVQY